MSLNIKNEETCRLIHELAEATGESLTGAITAAVKEKLEKIQTLPHSNRYERMMAIARDAASRIEEPWKPLDHGEFLYDEKGLPE